MIGIINQDSQAGWLPTIGNQKYLLAILVVAVMTGLMYIYLNYSKQGYEIAVVGESRRTASYAGIKVDRVIIRTMALSGALCGLIGLLLTSSTDHTMTTTIVDGRGFTAVMVSWMAKFNPIIMIFVSLLLVVLNRGAGEISTAFGLNRSFADILTGIILFFIIGCEFFINYKVSSVLPERRRRENMLILILYPSSPRGHAGYPPAVRQHRRDPHREVRQPEPGYPRHHVCGRYLRRHRRVLL